MLRAQSIPGTAAVEAAVAAAHADIIVNQNAILAEAGVLAEATAANGYAETAAEEATEAAHHLHAYSRTVGSTAGVAPGVITSLTPYQATSGAGANNYGNAVLVLDGTEGDFGLPASMQPINSFDPSEVFVTDVSANGRIWGLRFIFEQPRGVSAPYANAAAAGAAGAFSDQAVKVDQTNADSTPVPMLSKRLLRGSKMWVQVKDSVGAGTISFLLTRLHG